MSDRGRERFRELLTEHGVITKGLPGTMDTDKVIDDWIVRLTGQMTQKERYAALHLLAKDSESAYLNYVSGKWDELLERERAAEDQETAQWAAEHPGGATARAFVNSVLQGPVAIGQYAGRMVDALANGYMLNDVGVNRNSIEKRMGDRAAILQGAEAQRLGQMAGDALEGAGNWIGNRIGAGDIGTNWGLGEKGNKAAQVIYGAGMSSIQSFVNQGLFGNAGTAIMGAGSMAQTMTEATDNGATPEQAMQLAVISGIVEMWTESQAFDDLEKYVTEPMDRMGRRILSSMAGEGMEEAVGEMINQMAEESVMRSSRPDHEGV